LKIITTHSSTDFDAFASMTAATVIYPGAIPVLPGRVNPNVRAFLSIHKDRFPSMSPREVPFDKVHCLIVVDTNSWSRLDGMSPLRDRHDLEIHLWDHHQEPGDVVPTWQRCAPVGAATTLFVQELERRKTELSPIESTLFLAGIYEDTGNLTFPGTTAQDAKAVAYLLEHQADLVVLDTILRPTYGPRQKDILFEMLTRAKRVKIKGYRVSICKMEIEGNAHGLSLVVHMYRDILNVDAAFGIFTESRKNHTIVIGRSGVDSLNVGAMMRSMGGGGHPAAGSAMLKKVNPDAVVDWITELIRGNQGSSIRIADLMSFPVTTVSPSMRMQQVAALLREKGVSGMPVVEGQKVVGIISRRDLNKLKKPSLLDAPVKAFMSRDVVTITPEKSVPEATRLMVKHDIGRLPVVEDGRLIGIVTRSDAMTYYYDLLPE